MDTLLFDIYDVVSKSSVPRILANATGGEFSQRAVDGINANLQKWDIQYTKRSGAEVKSAGDFFTAQGGYKAFFWTPPGETTPRKFICPTYTRVLDHYNVVQSITAKLEEIP